MSRTGSLLTNIPPELFHEILSHFPTLPFTYFCPRQPMHYGPSEYRERTQVLRALSQTSRALRAISLPLLWSRLDTCWVPEHAKGIWYKYVMWELERKSEGLREATHLHQYIKVITFEITKPFTGHTVPSLAKLLKVSTLTNLHTIHVIHCKSSGPLSDALAGVRLPTVRKVIVPTYAHSILRSCPNATEVRCIGGTGKELISALTYSKCEAFEGYVDWTIPKLMERLVMYAPALRKIEIRQTPKLRDELFLICATAISHLSRLSNLTVIQLTFANKDPIASDETCIKAAREVLLASKAKGQKELRVRRVSPSYHTNSLTESEWHSSSAEYL